MKKACEQIRAFIAIQIPDPVKALFRDLQGKLKKSCIHASFPSPETLHLTLKFLGHIPPGDIGTIEKSMEKAVIGIRPHTLFASGIGVFPSVKHTRIIWSGIRGEIDNLENFQPPGFFSFGDQSFSKRIILFGSCSQTDFLYTVFTLMLFNHQIKISSRVL